MFRSSDPRTSQDGGASFRCVSLLLPAAGGWCSGAWPETPPFHFFRELLKEFFFHFYCFSVEALVWDVDKATAANTYLLSASRSIHCSFWKLFCLGMICIARTHIYSFLNDMIMLGLIKVVVMAVWNLRTFLLSAVIHQSMPAMNNVLPCVEQVYTDYHLVETASGETKASWWPWLSCCVTSAGFFSTWLCRHL